jgi:hypothetical protein
MEGSLKLQDINKIQMSETTKTENKGGRRERK